MRFLASNLSRKSFAAINKPVPAALKIDFDLSKKTILLKIQLENVQCTYCTCLFLEISNNKPTSVALFTSSISRPFVWAIVFCQCKQASQKYCPKSHTHTHTPQGTESTCSLFLIKADRARQHADLVPKDKYRNINGRLLYPSK